MASGDKENFPMLLDASYSDLSDEKPAERQQWLNSIKTPRSSRYHWRWLILATIAVTTMAFGSYYYFDTSQISQCGTTADEARSKGCTFETSSFSWLPPGCTDPEVEAEFQSNSRVQFYRDSNYTQTVSAQEVRSGNGDGFYVTHHYHQAHCAFLLKKLHRAYARGARVDGLIISVHHTSHCVKMLLDPPADVWTHSAFAYTKFPYCGKKGGYNVEWARRGEWTE